MKNTTSSNAQSSNNNSVTAASTPTAHTARRRFPFLHSALRNPHFALIALLLAGGCTLRQAYPETQIHGYINGQPFTIRAPKDSSLVGFDAMAQTNGTVHVHIDSLQASLNATNLANAANGQAAIISATAQAVNQAFASAASAAAAAAAAVAK